MYVDFVQYLQFFQIRVYNEKAEFGCLEQFFLPLEWTKDVYIDYFRSFPSFYSYLI